MGSIDLLRVGSLVRSPTATLLHNAGAWHLSADPLRAVRTWEDAKIRKLSTMRRAGDEDQKTFTKRTGGIIIRWTVTWKMVRAHEKVLQMVHRETDRAAGSNGSKVRNP